MAKEISDKIYLFYYKLYKNKSVKENKNVTRRKVNYWEHNLREIYNYGDKQKDGSIIYITDDGTKTLTKELIDLLNAENFNWKLNNTWEENFNILKTYIESNEAYKGLPIQSFADEMRKFYNKGIPQDNGDIFYITKTGKRILKKEQIDKLNSINFVWNENDKIWLDNYYAFKDYVSKNNKYPTEKKLNRWYLRQRETFLKGERRKDGTIKIENTILKPWQIDMLNEINFIWVVYEKAYYRKKLKTKASVQGAERYLLSKLKKYLQENNKEATIYNLEDELKLMLK